MRHLQAFEAQGWTWPPKYETDAELAGALDHMPKRQAECAWYHTKLARAQGISEGMVVDLNMSIDFSSAPRGNRACCLVSTAKPYAIRRLRDICGYEAFNFQGLWRPNLRPCPSNRAYIARFSHSAV